MKAMLSRRPSAAMLVALIALFAATGGVGYAAATIDSGDILDNSIRSGDVLNRHLRADDVKKNSLGGGVIKESSLAKVPSAGSADTAQQATTAQDAVNAQNAANAQTAASAQTAANAQNAANAQDAVNAQTAAAVGPNGVGPAALQTNSVTGPKLGTLAVRTQTVSVPSGDTVYDEVSCQPGEQLLSGGARWDGDIMAADAVNLHVVHSFPMTTSWGARGYNGTGAARDLTIRGLCLDN
jgi:hypothetical protein